VLPHGGRSCSVHFQLPMELGVVFTNPQNLSDETWPDSFGKTLDTKLNTVSTESIVFLNDISAFAFLLSFSFLGLRMK
jgi:hypothetical protein